MVEAAEAGVGAGRTVLVVLTSCTLVQTLLAMSLLAIPAIGPELAAGVGVDPGAVGFQITTVYVTAMLASLMGGDVVARFGAVRAMQIALVLAAVGLALATVPEVPVIALGSLVIGVGYALTNPAAAHLLARTTAPQHRNLVFSIKQTGVPAGGVIAGLLLPSVTVLGGWQLALGVAAALCLGLALAVQPLRASQDGDRDRTRRLGARPLAALELVWRQPALRRLVLACAGFAAVQLMIMAYAVTLLVEERDFGLVTAGAILALMQAAGVVGRLIWGVLADRWFGGPRTLAVTGLSSALACLALGLTPLLPAGAAPLLLVVLGFTAIGWNGVYVAEVARLAGQGQAGQATGGAMTIVFVGTTLGPSAFALAYGVIGSFATTFAVASALLFLGGGVVATLARSERAPAAASRRA